MGADTQIGVRKTIFFDGVCNLCNSSVNFIIDRDKESQFTFASLQSVYAEKTFSETDIDPNQLEGIIYLKGDNVLRKSEAVLEIVRELSGGWSLLYGFRILPKAIRDKLYDWIAKNRYRWFGKRETCRVSTPDLKERFLDS